jgi:hypothetical protein
VATAKKEPEVQSTTLGEPGETCSSCGAPLATDQRYCLNCGTRRGGPRLDYVQYLTPAGDAKGAGRGGRANGRDASPHVAVAGIALLGLMLLVGVLIGRGGEPNSTEPTVVRVEGGGETASTDTSSTEKAAPAENKAKKGAAADAGAPVEEASTEELEALQNASGDDYLEQSQNLPNDIQTPGAPPPKDNVKPGGGSGGGSVIE